MNQTFWGAPMRSGKDRLAKILVILAVLAAVLMHLVRGAETRAAEPTYSDDWYRVTQDILNGEHDIQPLDTLEPTQDQLEAAKSVSEQAEAIAMKQIMDSPAAADLVNKPADVRPVVFISYSIPEDRLKEILVDGTAHGATFVLRGFHPEASTFRQNLKKLQDLIQDYDPLPNVMLNPGLFDEWGVTVVPTAVLEQGGRLLTRQTGDFSVSWLIKRHKAEPDTQDFGTFGEVWPIVEVNLIEMMKARFNAIDWPAKKQQALDTYWDRYTFVTLPVVSKSATFEIDPTIRVTEDIRTPDNQLIAQQGSTYNPLHSVPFTSALVVFDATDPEQMAVIADKARHLFPHKRIKFITTELDREKGFEALKAMEQALNAPVFLLNNAIRERFALTHTPAYIDATRDRLVVRYIKPGE